MTILLVSFSERLDLIDFFRQDSSNSYYLLDYSNHASDTSSADFLKGTTRLSELSDVKAFARELRPDRVVFFETSDIRLSCLNILFRSLAIPVIFLDHGLRDKKIHQYVRAIEEQRAIADNPQVKLPARKTATLFFHAMKALKAKDQLRVLVRFVFAFSRSGRSRLFNYMLRMGNYFSKVILYSPNSLEVVSLTVRVDDDNLCYTGFPPTDSYYSLPVQELANRIVFIDHPQLEAGLINDQQHEEIARAFERTAKRHNCSILVKLHPKSNPQNWLRYQLDPLITIEQGFPPPSFYLAASLIISFSSTMLVSFLSKKKNVVLLSWNLGEEHMGVNFAKMGVCHYSDKIQDLEQSWGDWLATNLCESRPDRWAEFIKAFNYPFDGQATRRVIQNIVARV